MSEHTPSPKPSSGHIPVLCQEVLEALLPDGRPLPSTGPDLFVDCTLGGGGHARALIERYRNLYGDKALNEHFALLGIDQDPAILQKTKQQLLEAYPGLKLYFYHGNFSQVQEAILANGFQQVTGGLLADIGVSSFQLDQAERGFSFNKTAPLDMRMNTTAPLTAADIVNTYSEKELVSIFSEYGEERFSKTIARLIVERRQKTPFETTTDLAEMITTLYRKKLPPKAYRIHPATKVFQALRIAVNDELGVLQEMLNSLPALLSSKARAAVISFHSLEDRIVKNTFRSLFQNDGDLELVTRKPLIASTEEIAQNPRSRSAKLRVVERR